MWVRDCRRDHQDAAGRHHTGAVAFTTPFRMIQLRILTERNIPHELACVQVHRRERAPGWRGCRIAIWIAERPIALRAVPGMRFRIDRDSVTSVSTVAAV